MNRTKFYEVVEVEDVNELDFLFNTLSSFTTTRTSSYYRTDIGDRIRPDKISFRLYGTVRYWWVICLVNKIFNPLVDIEEGQVLEIPNIQDIYDFYQKFNLR